MKRYHVIVVEASPMVYVPEQNPTPPSTTPISDALEQLARAPRPALDVIVDIDEMNHGDGIADPGLLPVQRQVRMALEAARPSQ